LLNPLFWFASARLACLDRILRSAARLISVVQGEPTKNDPLKGFANISTKRPNFVNQIIQS
jgi:hypothetical protein